MVRRTLALLCLLAAPRLLLAAPPPSPTTMGPRPTHFFSYRLPEAALRASLARAVGTPSGSHRGVLVQLPMPDGRTARFRVVESPVLGLDFARVHPDLRTFLIAGVDDARLSGRLDLTTSGLHAIVFTPEGMALVDPIERGRTDAVMSYWLKDDMMGEFQCLQDATIAARAAGANAAQGSAGSQLRTFRLILMATGEYTQALGGVPQALAQMTTSVNRINAIFERDATVHLDAVQMMAFPNAATDPYPSTSVGALLTRNNVVVDSIFGPDAYDITQAIAVTGVYRGVSFRPLECDSEYKGQSSMQGIDPTSNFFVIKVMPHELGHTLGATHTQDNSGNRDAITPFEPSLGWTIMTNPGDPASFDDAFFHVANLAQIDSTLRLPMECVTLVASGNTPPTAAAGPDYTIPRGTPFSLTGSGGDADAGDALTYSWDEVDGAPLTGDLTLGPLFRWRPPTSSPSRSFPDAATVLSGVADPLEKLPTVDRLLHFRLVVRDNHAGAGGHAWDDVTLTVSGAPFVVTAPNGGESFLSSQPIPVTWTVGGGSVAPLVDIRLSVDGGANWITLASGTPNDGAQNVSYAPGATRNACRIKVEAAGNVFYDVSNANFAIIDDATPALLSLLECVAIDERLEVRWQFAHPDLFPTVTVERAEQAAGQWGEVPGERLEDGAVSEFVDDHVEPGRTYWYRLQAGADGQVTTFGPISGRAGGPPAEFGISALSPNPARDVLRIDYALPKAGRVRLRVLDVQGRVVAKLVDGWTPAGRFQSVWPGLDTRGRAPGLYFVRLDCNGASAVRRAVISR